MLKKMRNLQFRKDKKNQKGFTLVELMATLGILALIVAIAVPAIGGIMDNASESALESDIDMVEKSAEIAYVSEESPDDTYTVGDLQTLGYLDFDESGSKVKDVHDVNRNPDSNLFTYDKSQLDL